MKIAQVAPLWESVPPKHGGATECIVSYVTEELVKMGHDVTLFASGDSITSAKLEAVCPEALSIKSGIFNRDASLILLLERAFGSAAGFDLIHSHVDFLGFPLARRNRTPVLTTLHGRLDSPELSPIFREFQEMPLVSISDAQRRAIPWANWHATIHYGLPRSLYTFRPNGEGYLAFLGRIAREERPDHAIALAKRTGLQLRIAAKVDLADQHYYQSEIEPFVNHPLIEFVGDLSDLGKDDFIGNATALVCPYDWPGPFGLFFIEALACGTPVIAYRRGSTPEIIEDGVTGYICNTLDEMEQAVKEVQTIDRQRCRLAFEKRFTADRMAQDYVALYQRIVEGSAHALNRKACVGQSSPMEYPGRA